MNTKARLSQFRSGLPDRLRAWPWLAFALVTTTIVAIVAPQQVGLLAWAGAKLSWGAFLGYWIDRSIFRYSRPHEAWDIAELSVGFKEHRAWFVAGCLRELRRAVIIAATILALGVGV